MKGHEGIRNRRRRNAIARNLLLTLAIFSWPGMLGVRIGIEQGNLGLVVGGLLFTLFIWSIYIIPLYKDWLRSKTKVGLGQLKKPALHRP